MPGGFRLPVALLQEQIIYCASTVNSIASVHSCDWLDAQAEQYLRSGMVAGKILDRFTTMEQMDDKVILIGNYACVEMIGQLYYEEIYTRNG